MEKAGGMAIQFGQPPNAQEALYALQLHAIALAATVLE